MNGWTDGEDSPSKLWKGTGTPVVCQLFFPGLPHCSLRKLKPGENKAFVAKQGLNFRPPVPPYWAWVGCPNPSALPPGGLRCAVEQHQGAGFPAW